MTLKKNILRWSPLLLLMLLLAIFFYFRLYQYLSFTSLQQHRQMLLRWTTQHSVLVALSYILIYQIAVAVSIPGAVFFTLIGGFLFGIIVGTIFVVIGATLGATWLFLAIRTAVGPSLAHRSSRWVNKMRKGFQENAFSYLLVLRLVPVFPFWVVNIVPALLGVRLKTFILATFLGVIPGSFVFVLLGNSLGFILDQGQTPNLKIIFAPHVLLPLLGLALLSLAPILYKHLKKSET